MWYGKNDNRDLEGLSEGAIKGLCDHGDNHGRYPVSRDWEDIDCATKSCLYNYSDGNFGKCTTPSRAKIGEDGKCMGFLANVSIKKEERKPDNSHEGLEV